MGELKLKSCSSVGDECYGRKIPTLLRGDSTPIAMDVTLEHSGSDDARLLVLKFNLNDVAPVRIECETVDGGQRKLTILNETKKMRCFRMYARFLA